MLIDLSTLEGWLSTREGEHLEFKAARHDYPADKLTKYMVALANEGGGHLVMGVTDEVPRQVCGTQAYTNYTKFQKQLTELLRLRVSVTELDHPQGRVLVWSVPSHHKGVPVKHEGVYWARSGESLSPMTEDRLRELLIGASPATPVPAPSTDIAGPYQLIYERVHQVFEWHDLDALRATQLLSSFRVTVATLSSPSQLVAHLSEDVLAFLTSTFQVSREFLLGKSSKPSVEAGFWYKDPRDLCARIAELRQWDMLAYVAFVTVPESVVYGKKRRKLPFFGPKYPEEDMFIMLGVQRSLGEHSFYTFELWETGLWSYPKCRLDLKAIALFCEKLQERCGLVHVRGGSLQIKVFEAVTNLETHLAQVIFEGYGGIGPKWHPTDFVSDYDHLAKERHEMPSVLEHYEWYGLDRLLPEENSQDPAELT